MVSVAALCCLPSAGLAQDYPTRLVKIVVPYAPGGGVDLIARMLAERLNEKWKSSVIVENKTGAATLIGAAAVAKATPDGYTLLLTSESTITSNPFLYAKLPYDPIRDLVPITQLISLPQVIVANPSVAANSLQELIQSAKSKKTDLNYASYGSGSLPHLLFDGLKLTHGVPLTQIPYKGVTPAIQALLAGEIQLTMAGFTLAQPHIRAGTIKPLAVARATRLAELPNVPTLREAGLGDIDPHSGWFGLFVTRGTPASVVQKISRSIAEITADPAFRARIVQRGFEPVFSTPEEFSKFIQVDLRQKERLIRLTGAKAE